MIDQFFVSIRRPVSDESFHFHRLRRQAGQIQAEAAGQGAAVRFGRRLEARLFQPGEYEIIDWIPHPAAILDLRQGRTFGSDQRPMGLVLRAGGNPAFEQILLLSGKDLVRLGRRHDVIRVAGIDALDQQAGIGFAGDDGRLTVLARGGCIFRPIQAQAGFAGRRIGAVTGETVLGNDGPDVAIEFDIAGRRGCAGAKPGDG